ncbi:MAG: hypothetical protein ACM3NO_11355 [Deltaproteobacteria bacterium]
MAEQVGADVRADGELKKESTQNSGVDATRAAFHDAANAVNVLMAQCFLLQLDETVSPSVRERLDAIEQAVERLAKFLREERQRRASPTLPEPFQHEEAPERISGACI